MSEHETIAVDFDGVIHSYARGWQGAHIIADPPMPGAMPWLHQMIQHFRVVIFTSRAREPGGEAAVRAWLRKKSEGLWQDIPGQKGLKHLEITAEKIPARIYIDDRAWKFTGRFPTIGQILAFQPGRP